jgi:hypothetical protein
MAGEAAQQPAKDIAGRLDKELDPEAGSQSDYAQM